MTPHLRCPCCGASASHYCPRCGHIWHANERVPTGYYAGLSGRNAVSDRYLERKFAGRIRDLAPRIRPGMRLLEIGCAEGMLGARIKKLQPVTYCGVEPSSDARIARLVLDAVALDSTECLSKGEEHGYDAVISFHVLEHIAQPAEELATWRRLLKPQGWIMLEVPDRSGHPDLDVDTNPEHLHAFSAASVTCLLLRTGFDVVSLSTGHFESPFYSNSLRIVARPRRSVEAQKQRLLARFRAELPSQFAVYGVGGDFRNYVQPILGELPVAAILDGDPRRLGEFVAGFAIEPYAHARHGDMLVLVASLRHEASIAADLEAAGHAPQNLRRLAEIYDKELPE